MSERKKRITGFLPTLVAAICLLVATYTAYALEEVPAVLNDIRFGEHGNSVRTVLDFTGKPDYFLALDGSQVVRVDLYHVSSDVKKKEWDLPAGIETVELKDKGEGTFVFRITAKAGLFLEKQGLLSDPYRLYIDLGTPKDTTSSPQELTGKETPKDTEKPEKPPEKPSKAEAPKREQKEIAKQALEATAKETPVVVPVPLKKTKKSAESVPMEDRPSEPRDMSSKAGQLETTDALSKNEISGLTQFGKPSPNRRIRTLLAKPMRLVLRRMKGPPSFRPRNRGASSGL
ncbi:MAG: hypothetical protein HY788_12075 [Deltaproteobacteria bacterium]|nr:hypothetical protein [Deltaproteobacteria bacterium]